MEMTDAEKWQALVEFMKANEYFEDPATGKIMPPGGATPAYQPANWFEAAKCAVLESANY